MRWRPLGRRAPDMASRQRSFHPPGVTFHRDVSAGLWVQKGFGPRFAHIETLLPRGFEAYARIFHPARALDDHPVRWSDVAVWSGRMTHPLMVFERISVPTPESERTDRGPAPWHDDPAFGGLDEDQATVLVDFLRGFTSTPESCFFGVWEGYGQFHSGGRAYVHKSGARNWTLLPILARQQESRASCISSRHSGSS